MTQRPESGTSQPPIAESAAELNPPVIAYIGLGANLGDLPRTLREALAAMAALPGTRLLAVSGAYRSAPVEAGGPDFLNAVAQLETSLPPLDLLDALQAIELAHGRERPYLNAPRTLDLDVLAYGEMRFESPRLNLPHPRLHQRAFTLLPLLEFQPNLQLPGLANLRDYLPGVASQTIQRLDLSLHSA
ncbi:2-amino-4-hydroxy-6-hydroxymethyldihydropteridine diphosphokinase [Paucibacter sp. KCTC 42545]|uniref:2-amino-4-hydroxy-6- hydroxymethyldihydropteridine diphosphokinase n=1 Tax=Paucibacter sp. KCTC 42545 TaxID=1768242 RepID=UPI0009E9DFB4|nr:2-amino-4-hydroxy-6-hydroxymethyldihydropteridine diphosphokinase [Paucibacter sp. KCTC 42545]